MTKRFNPTRRLGAVAIAAALTALAGAASAQSGFVTDSRGNLVRSTYSDCVRTGQGGANTPCPPAGTTISTAAAPASSQPARLSAGAPAGRGATYQSAATGGTATGMPGYAIASDGRVVQNGFGQCVRAGHWTAGNAAEPCDRVARADVPPPAPVAIAPEPKLEPAPAPLAQAVPAPEAPRPVIQKLTLSTDVLFDFNSAELKEAGKRKLDELAGQVKDANVDEIIAIGHADRIASEDFNLKLSEARAQAVKDYLASKASNANRVTAQGKGESSPVTGEDCKNMGPERGSNKKLVACLQPDRRVEIEVLGTRQLAGEAPAAGTGASAPASSGSTTR
jgi:OmpA-OmpF porin, OOP family